MIAEELKKIREAEEKARSIVVQAEKDSKLKIESAKKEIQASISRERRDIEAHGEEMKQRAEEEALNEAKLVRAQYREKAEKIRSIDDERIRQTAMEIIEELVR